jgi:hypothetical protein
MTWANLYFMTSLCVVGRFLVSLLLTLKIALADMVHNPHSIRWSYSPLHESRLRVSRNSSGPDQWSRSPRAPIVDISFTNLGLHVSRSWRILNSLLQISKLVSFLGPDLWSTLSFDQRCDPFANLDFQDFLPYALPKG